MSRAAVFVGLGLGLVLGGCGGGQHAATPSTDGTGDVIVEEGAGHPAYSKAALDRALIEERGKEATAERIVADLEAKGEGEAMVDERLLTARADLGVRRRFIAALAACQGSGQLCPPRIDDPAWRFEVDEEGAKPSLDAPLRFDLDSWRAVAAELHGRACACRTIACVDGVGVAIDQVEGRPMKDDQSDDAAIEAITAARTCLYRLRGLAVGTKLRAAE